MQATTAKAGCFISFRPSLSKTSSIPATQNTTAATTWPSFRVARSCGQIQCVAVPPFISKQVHCFGAWRKPGFTPFLPPSRSARTRTTPLFNGSTRQQRAPFHPSSLRVLVTWKRCISAFLTALPSWQSPRQCKPAPHVRTEAPRPSRPASFCTGIAPPFACSIENCNESQITCRRRFARFGPRHPKLEGRTWIDHHCRPVCYKGPTSSGPCRFDAPSRPFHFGLGPASVFLDPFRGLGSRRPYFAGL